MNLICKKPFEWFEIGDAKNLNVNLCCSGWLPTPIGSLRKSSASNLWNGLAAKLIRKSVTDGSFRYCNTEFCPHLSNPGASDSPVTYVTDDELADIVKLIDDSDEKIPPPKTINLAYDKSCNLACPSCRHDIVQADKKERQDYKALLSDVLSDFDDGPITLYMTGSGDPFGSRHFWEVITSDEFVNDHSLRFRLHTNGVLFNANRFERLRAILPRVTDIEISIDGATKETYEANRRPAKWEALLGSMELFAQVKREYPQINMKLNFVVQANNWREMPYFVDLGRNWGVDVIKFSKLNNWGTFTDLEYHNRAVHWPGHRDYQGFIDSLCQPAFRNKLVRLDDF